MKALRQFLLFASRPLLFFILAGAGLAASTVTHAQTPVPSDDTAGIDSTLASFGTTLTDMDFNKFATLWTEDADFVNIVGMHWHGKADIVKGHTAVFTTRYRHVAQHTVDRSIALLSPTMALVVTKISLDDYTAQDGRHMTDNLFRMTLVLQKHDGRWLIRAAENTVLDVEANKHDPVHPA